ncbi:hypothetical protein MMC06_006180, partial [Schaereria dolodes]|nr:hypothetical protein [Schaereria dolodes]
MNAAILDTAFGTASTHGFSAFFKTSNNADYVAGLLTKMAQGALVEPWVSHKPELDPTSPTPPTLICPNEGMILDDAGDTSDPGPYETCQGPNLAAFTDVVYNAIFLCDHFFTWTTSPRTRNCPAVDTFNNEFRANDFQSSGFTDYQSYVLVHELVHLYSAGEDLNAGTEPPEKYDLNECVSLPAELSIYNPENYVLYVA